jgi:RimJ/RimL family protein N-acetyltransferase
MRDFSFRQLGVKRIVTSYIAGNRFAARLNRGMGLVIGAQNEYVRRSGERIQVVHLELTHERWEQLSIRDGSSKF